MRRMATVLVLGSLVLGSTNCASKAQTGALIGAGSGALVGGAIGKAAGNTAVGAILGATVGGAAGAIIGHYMDEQAREIERDLEGARIERVGEGIKITFDSGILFDVNSAHLQTDAQLNLIKLAKILNKYDDTDILIEGHTDATGTEEYNLDLSRRRSQSVANQLATGQVDATRFTLMGYGEAQPITSNDTAEGRQENRRVELAIMANEKLKKATKSQVGE